MLKSPMMTGADVRVVQQALNQLNHAGLATDGAYGPATRDAVLNWQRRAHIEVDGIRGGRHHRPAGQILAGPAGLNGAFRLGRTPRISASKPGPAHPARTTSKLQDSAPVSSRCCGRAGPRWRLR